MKKGKDKINNIFLNGLDAPDKNYLELLSSDILKNPIDDFIDFFENMSIKKGGKKLSKKKRMELYDKIQKTIQIRCLMSPDQLAMYDGV